MLQTILMSFVLWSRLKLTVFQKEKKGRLGEIRHLLTLTRCLPFRVHARETYLMLKETLTNHRAAFNETAALTSRIMP